MTMQQESLRKNSNDVINHIEGHPLKKILLGKSKQHLLCTILIKRRCGLDMRIICVCWFNKRMNERNKQFMKLTPKLATLIRKRSNSNWLKFKSCDDMINSSLRRTLCLNRSPISCIIYFRSSPQPLYFKRLVISKKQLSLLKLIVIHVPLIPK